MASGGSGLGGEGINGHRGDDSGDQVKEEETRLKRVNSREQDWAQREWAQGESGAVVHRHTKVLDRCSSTGAPRPVLLPDRPSVVVVGGYHNPYWSRPYNLRAAWARPYWDRPWCAAASVQGHGCDTLLTCARARADLHPPQCPCLPSLRRHARHHPWKQPPPRPWWAVPRLVEKCPSPLPYVMALPHAPSQDELGGSNRSSIHLLAHALSRHAARQLPRAAHAKH